jgi:hypothetical protein
VLIGHHLNINIMCLDSLGIGVNVVRWVPLRYTKHLTIRSLLSNYNQSTNKRTRIEQTINSSQR